MMLGLDALQLGLEGDARELFGIALAGIETVYGESQQAAKARSLWRAEGSKVFKGEPYERAMAFYYAGVTYLSRREWDNARASFRGGLLQDAFAEEEQYRSDSALMHYLFGWASRRMGDGDGERFGIGEALRLRPELAGLGSGDNVLVIAELGRSPRKRTDGIGHAELRFFRGRGFTEARARVVLDSGAPVPLVLAEDLFWQASTRGARQIDRILKDKVVYVQSGVSDVRAMADAARAPATDSGQSAVDLFSGIAKIVASNVVATADGRYWANLPDTIHLATARLPAGRHRLRFEFLDGAGNLLPALTGTQEIEVPESDSMVIWGLRPAASAAIRRGRFAEPGDALDGRSPLIARAPV